MTRKAIRPIQPRINSSCIFNSSCVLCSHTGFGVAGAPESECVDGSRRAPAGASYQRRASHLAGSWTGQAAGLDCQLLSWADRLRIFCGLAYRSSVSGFVLTGARVSPASLTPRKPLPLQ